MIIIKRRPRKKAPPMEVLTPKNRFKRLVSSILNGMEHLHESRALHRARGNVRKRRKWTKFRKKRGHRFHIYEYNDYTLKRTPGVTRGILVLQRSYRITKSIILTT